MVDHMTDKPEQAALAIEQRHRDAAASAQFAWPRTQKAIRCGEHDHGELAQAFARFEQSILSADRQRAERECERLREALAEYMFAEEIDDDGECWNCSGEGYVYGCSWDWQCDTYDAGEGTCLCTHPCHICHAPKATGAA